MACDNPGNLPSEGKEDDVVTEACIGWIAFLPDPPNGDEQAKVWSLPLDRCQGLPWKSARSRREAVAHMVAEARGVVPGS